MNPMNTMNPASSYFLPYWEDDPIDLVLEIEALCQRYAGTQQEEYFEALEGQVLFGRVS